MNKRRGIVKAIILITLIAQVMILTTGCDTGVSPQFSGEQSDKQSEQTE